MNMSTPVELKRSAEMSPRFEARLAGVFYLLTALTGMFAEFFVRGRLGVAGDAMATTNNILTHADLYRSGFASALAASTCYLVVTALFYNLFKPVSRTLSLIAIFFSLTACAVQIAFNCLFNLAPFVLLKDAPYLNVFKVEQVQALGYMFLRVRVQAHQNGMVFYGLYTLVIGYLILRSTFLPRILGVLMTVGGLGYLTFLWLPLADYVEPYNLAPGALAGLSLALWLLLMGVNVQRWREQARSVAHL
jgi:hypothetical protein